MVKVKAVKPPKVARAKVVKGAKIPLQPTQTLLRSPTTRSNSASIREGETILDGAQQKQFKMWIPEIKQIQGLIICRVGLNIQERTTCSQTLQESIFVSEYETIYKELCEHPLLGSRVKKIPFIYITVGTSKATEILSGDKMRKKYSTMKTYICNTLSPIYQRYDHSQ